MREKILKGDGIFFTSLILISLANFPNEFDKVANPTHLFLG